MRSELSPLRVANQNHKPRTTNQKPQTPNHTQQPEQQQHRQPQQPQQLDPYHLNMGPWPTVARKRLNSYNIQVVPGQAGGGRL